MALDMGEDAYRKQGTGDDMRYRPILPAFLATSMSGDMQPDTRHYRKNE